MTKINSISRLLIVICLSTLVSCSSNKFSGNFDEVITGKTLAVVFHITYRDAETMQMTPRTLTLEKVDSTAIEVVNIRFTAIGGRVDPIDYLVKASAWYDKSGELTLTWKRSENTYTYPLGALYHGLSLEFRPSPGDRLMKVSVVFEHEDPNSPEVFTAIR